MLQLNNFFAWVSVDDVELREYNVEYSEDGKRATCWIASNAGKNFSVFWKDTVRSSPTSGRVSVDGIRCNGKVIYPASEPGGARDTAYTNAVPTSTSTQRLLTFSNVELTDDDSYLDSSASQELGEIKVEIWKVTIKGITPYEVKGFPEAKKVHERSKKATNHRITLGAEVKCQQLRDMISVESVELLTTFIFKYRALDILQANGIVPNDAGPQRVPLPCVANDDGDVEQSDEIGNLEEIRALKKRLRELREKDRQRHKRVKLEVKVEPRGHQIGEVIDLT